MKMTKLEYLFMIFILVFFIFFVIISIISYEKSTLDFFDNTRVNYTRFIVSENKIILSTHAFGNIYDCLQNVDVPNKYEEYLKQISLEMNIPYLILVRLIKFESNFNEKCRAYNKKSDTWDYGIMQINSNNIDYFASIYNDGKPFDIFNWKENVYIGSRYLKDLYDYFLSWDLAIMAYNCGLNRVIKQNIPSTTIAYCNNILTFD